jgi:hypothetical protein
MPHIPKVPTSCVGLDLALVERTLTKHQASVAAAAKELGVPVSDLRRLTWAKPDLLQTALDEMAVVVARAEGVLIQMLYSDDPRCRERAADKILGSYAARNPHSPRRGRRAGERRLTRLPEHYCLNTKVNTQSACLRLVGGKAVVRGRRHG